MNEKIYTYDEGIAFIEAQLNNKLYKYQREILKAIWEGKEIRSARAQGRNFLTENFLSYMAYVYGKRICDETPALIMSYESFMSGDS